MIGITSIGLSSTFSVLGSMITHLVSTNAGTAM
jgi:hypothetical protein